MKPKFFKTPKDFRAWLDKNHAKEKELLVGFFKVDSRKPSITWPQSVDEALCFGWIDGVRRRIDNLSYSIRFSPRKATSIWSQVNTKRVGELNAEGRMTPAGMSAFERRNAKKSAIYSYERKHATLDEGFLRKIQSNKKAWTYYSAQPPHYRHATGHWIMSAKRDETRERRLATLIECSRKGEWIPPLTPSGKSKRVTG